MKLLHTSDWHLGKTVMGMSMLGEQENFIENVLLPAVDAEKPDAVTVAGDVFDRQVPPVEAVRLFSHAVDEICGTRGIPMAVIAGNHDGADRLAVYAGLLRGRGLYLSARPFDTPPLRLHAHGQTVLIHLLPYFEPAFARAAFNRDDIRGFGAAYHAVVGKVKETLEPGAFHVLAAHCFAAGSSTCESESPLSVGGSEEVDPGVFAGFDYIALGHLHGPQRVGANGAYSGSPLKYSFDEEKQNKSIAVVSFSDAGVETKRLPCVPLHNMRTVTGSLKELLEAAKSDPGCEDYIFASLTDARPVFEPMALLREAYPNTLGLHPGWLDLTAGSGTAENRRALKNGGDGLLYTEFLRQVCGVEPEDGERRLFENIMKKVAERS